MKRFILLLFFVSFSQGLFADRIDDLIAKAKAEALAKNKSGMIAAMNELTSIKEKRAEFGILGICYWVNLPEEMKESCEPYAKKGVPIKRGVAKSENAPSKAIFFNKSVHSSQPKTVQYPQQNPICYISETGNRYHKLIGCSTKGSSELSPVYDADLLKRRGLTPCKKCWSGAPLY